MTPSRTLYELKKVPIMAAKYAKDETNVIGEVPESIAQQQD